jgi:hypothetical protein
METLNCIPLEWQKNGRFDRMIRIERINGLLHEA